MVRIHIDHQGLKVFAVGHAGAPRNEDGRDMVCCMVSTIVQTLLISCQELPGVIVDNRMDPGDVYMHISAPDRQYIGVMHRMQMAEDGLQKLAEQYPDCVQMF